MEIELQLKLTREEQLAIDPTVRIDITDAPLLNGVPPHDNPRIYGMTDAEAMAWNEARAAERSAIQDIESN